MKRAWFGDYGHGVDAEIDVEQYVHDYYLVVKNRDTHLIPLSDCCPCVKHWYIVGLCPCDYGDECEYDRTCRVGINANFPDHTKQDPHPVLDADGNQVRKIVMWEHDPWVDPAGNNDTFFCYDAHVGCTLQAIEHCATVPEGVSQVWAMLFVDGVFFHTTEQNIANPGETCLGWNYFGDDDADENKVALIKVIPPDAGPGEYGYVFTEAGDHTVDLRVVYVDSQDQTLHAYNCRAIVRIYDSGDPEIPAINAASHPYVGDVYIVPRRLILSGGTIIETGDGCAWYGANGMTMYGEIMKGPYNTREEAEYICAEPEVNGQDWRKLLSNWAEFCQCGECDPCNGPYAPSHMNPRWDNGDGEWHEYDNTSGKFTIVPTVCHDRYVISDLSYYFVVSSGTVSIKWTLVHADGTDGDVVCEDSGSNISGGVSNIITKPCEKLRFEMMASSGSRCKSGDGDVYCECTRYPLNWDTELEQKIIDCQSAGDDVLAIPRNSDELAAWLLESQQQARLLKSMPEGMA